jgi:DNA-binding helix-hairpin-helix protein with protein kinase domain
MNAQALPAMLQEAYTRAFTSETVPAHRPLRHRWVSA